MAEPSAEYDQKLIEVCEAINPHWNKGAAITERMALDQAKSAPCSSCRGAGRVIDVYAPDDESTCRCGQCFGTGVDVTNPPGTTSTTNTTGESK